LVEREGSQATAAIGQGAYGPNWTAADCTDQTVVTGADGVMVPMVTDEQKRKRRVTEAHKRQREGRRSTAQPGRPKSGSDGAYKW
jgi:2-keto-3-deoxy-L-rhamnonate aldolase RhmA